MVSEQGHLVKIGTVEESLGKVTMVLMMVVMMMMMMIMMMMMRRIQKIVLKLLKIEYVIP